MSNEIGTSAPREHVAEPAIDAQHLPCDPIVFGIQ
jgi:hypothetical protein